MILAKSQEFLTEYGSLPKYSCSDCGQEVEQRYSTKWSFDLCIKCHGKIVDKVQKVMDRMKDNKGYII